MNNLTIYIVDDEPSVLKSLQCLIESVGYRVKTFSNAHDFIETYTSNNPTCLIIDVRMPIISGLELQKYLKEKNIDIPIIFISGHGNIPMAVDTIKNGAIDFLTKPINNQNLLETINKAIKQDIIKHNKYQECAQMNALVNSLTKRELEIMTLMVKGKMTKHIANTLSISPNTVDQHRMKVMNKMNVKCIAELVNKVITYGLINECSN